MTRTRFRADTPFRALPELPPRVELETPVVLKACISARAALAELHVATDLIPNPSILINTIPILEAHASSEIENIVTTTDELFQFAADENAADDPATREGLRYRTALWRGFERLSGRPVSTNLAIDVCTTLRAIQTNVRRVPGTALRSLETGAAIYTPPDGEAHLRKLLANWEAFLHRLEELDPLVRMAVGHYQFEAIHPFEDGNGRTGRILNLLFLVEQGLLRIPVLYMSGVIIRRKSEYYRLLLEVTTRRRWQPWLLYMLQVVEETSRGTTAKIRAIRTLFETAALYIREKAPKIYTHELVQVIFEQPYCRIENVVNAGIARRQTAAAYLASLSDIGVLTPVQGGREKLFIHRPLLDLLTSDTHEPSPYGSPGGTDKKMTGKPAPKTLQRSLDLNRTGSIDERLRFAIANKLLIHVSYDGATRLLEPHDYGVQKSVQRLLAYQVRRTGGAPGRAITGWRLLDVSKIAECVVLEEAFAGSRGGSHLHHYKWDNVYARVA
jgi:Fic family protein